MLLFTLGPCVWVPMWRVLHTATQKSNPIGDAMPSNIDLVKHIHV